MEHDFKGRLAADVKQGRKAARCGGLQDGDVFEEKHLAGRPEM